MSLRRAALGLCCALALPAATVPAAAPAEFTVVGDTLDRAAPAATLPQGPVVQALAELAADSPQAQMLVLLRTGERSGVRYALSAWRSAPGAAEWDALLVLALPDGARLIEASSQAKDVEATLAALLAHAFATAAPAPPAPPPVKVEAPLPAPVLWEPRYLVLYTPVPGAPVGDAAAEAALAEAHLQYALRLQREGAALAAGPFTAATEAPAYAAALLLRVRDRAAAERIAAADPMVKAGRYAPVIREWRVPAGR